MSNSCDPIDGSPLSFSVHGIFQARILEWVAISSSRGSFRPRNWIYVFCIDRWILYHWVTWEAQFLFLWYFMSYPFLTRSSWDHGRLDPKAIFFKVSSWQAVTWPYTCIKSLKKTLKIYTKQGVWLPDWVAKQEAPPWQKSMDMQDSSVWRRHNHTLSVLGEQFPWWLRSFTPPWNKELWQWVNLHSPVPLWMLMRRDLAKTQTGGHNVWWGTRESAEMWKTTLRTEGLRCKPALPYHNATVKLHHKNKNKQK